MQVFQTFFKIASKRIGAISTYFIIYIFVNFALSFSTADTAETQFQTSSLTISILDEDSSAASRALTAFLSSLHKTDASETDTEALADRLYYRTLDYVLIIPDGFEEKLLSGDTEALLSDVKIPGSTNGSFVDQQITQYIKTLQLYLAGGCTLSEAIAHTDASAADSASVTAVSFSSQGVKADSRLFYFYQYLPYIFICIQFMGLAPILVTENSPGIRERTACSSLSFSKRNLQLAAACTVYSVGVWLIFMLFAALSTIIAVFENISAFSMELFGWSRKKATLINGFVIALLSMPCVLGFNLLAGFEPLKAGNTIMDLEDFLVSNLALPIGSLVYILFCTSKLGWGWKNFRQEANIGKGLKVPNWLRIYCTFILPLIVVVILVYGLITYFM